MGYMQSRTGNLLAGPLICAPPPSLRAERTLHAVTRHAGAARAAAIAASAVVPAARRLHALAARRAAAGAAAGVATALAAATGAMAAAMTGAGAWHSYGKVYEIAARSRSVTV